jgi:hypothetical protein
MSNDLNPLTAVQMAAERRPNLGKSGLSSANRPWFRHTPKERQRFFDFEILSIALGSGMCRTTRFWAYFGSSWTQVACESGLRCRDGTDDVEV